MPISPADKNWILELLKTSLPFFSALLGGGLALLGGWLADRRKQNVEDLARDRQEKALKIGMFAVSNHIVQRLNDYETYQNISYLEPLRTAQSYVHRIIDKAPSESESLMIALIDIGLKIDSLIATKDRSLVDDLFQDENALSTTITREVNELFAALGQFDIIVTSELRFMDEEELLQFPEYEIDSGSEAELKKNG